MTAHTNSITEPTSVDHRFCKTPAAGREIQTQTPAEILARLREKTAELHASPYWKAPTLIEPSLTPETA